MNRPQETGEITAEATKMEPTENPSASTLVEAIERAKQSIEAGDLEAGLQAFRDIASANPEIPEVFNNLGAICAAMGLRDEAEAAFGRAAELMPDTANPWYNRGLMRFEGGNNVGALEDFLRASELDPSDAEIHNNIGVIHFQLREFDAARRAFEQALSLRPHYPAASLNLADVDLAEGRHDMAIDRCHQALQNEEDPEITSKLIECCISASVSQIDQAAEATRQTIALAGESPALAEQLGRLVRARQTLLDEDLFANTAPETLAEAAAPAAASGE
jgi:Flp pilus assembly protein TadD